MDTAEHESFLKIEWMIIFLSDQNMQIRRFFKSLVSIWTVCKVLEVDFDMSRP